MNEIHEQRIRSAREMRINPTQAEKILWEELRGRRLVGLRFKKQCVMGKLIADFYCPASRLVIEVDGDIHDYQKEYDSIRTRHFYDHGTHVIRFTNEMVLNDLDNILSQIKAAAFGRSYDLTPGACPEARGGGRGVRSQCCTRSIDLVIIV